MPGLNPDSYRGPEPVGAYAMYIGTHQPLRTSRPVRDILQAQLWRWEIEVDFREEKSLLVCGQAQVRNPKSVECIPAFVAAMYGLLHLAGYRANADPDALLLPRPKWYKKQDAKRVKTGDLLNNLRAMLWAKATDLNFSDFVNKQLNTRSLRTELNFNGFAAFYMRNQPNLKRLSNPTVSKI